MMVQTCLSPREEAEALPLPPRRRGEGGGGGRRTSSNCDSEVLQRDPPERQASEACEERRGPPLPRPRSRRTRCSMGGRQTCSALRAAALLLGVLLAASEETVPRLSLRYDSPHRLLTRFDMPGITNYTAMMLSPDGGILYVGAREMLLALNTSAFSPGPQHQSLLWRAEEEKKRQCAFKGKDPQRDCHNYIKILLQLNETHLYTCGTSAFSPTCAYIDIPEFSLTREASGKLLLEDGKGRCPFDPAYKSTAIMVEGELYTGTVSNFQGNEPTIFRSHGSRLSIKTENSLNWLQDPFFVGSAYLRESLPPSSPHGEDDKIYFFFSESGKEFDFFEDTVVSRIARVCKGDVGGERVLQRRWTTFLKAQLLCSHPSGGFPFNVLQDMFVLTPGELWPETVFYGVFASQWDRKGRGGSAVCAFSLADVKEAFGGLYKEVNRETQQWYTDTHPVPEPRPGACITSHARQMKITSSLQMPDRVLNYLKDHFLMSSAVRSQPFLLQSRSCYQQISVQRVEGLHRAYDVLFLGTDDGWLHKAVLTEQEVHIIEEIQLFPAGQPVLKLLLDATQGLLYASSYGALVQAPVANCSLYQSCGECLLSRDPYCAWGGGACQPSGPSHLRLRAMPWLQDIEGGDAAQFCQGGSLQSGRSATAQDSQCQAVLVLHPSAVKTLPCPQLSNLASRHWLHNGAPINTTSFLVLPEGELVLTGKPDQTGRFECWSQEGTFRQLMASYCVRVEQMLQTWLVPAQNPLETISTSRSVAAAAGSSISALLEGKDYWTEFLVMCVIFAITVTLLTLFVLHRHRNAMKAFLKQGKCTSTHPEKPRKSGLPAENLPLNGASTPSALPDHKGYQALNDSRVASSPLHGTPVAQPGTAFLESDRRPLSVHASFVEVLTPSQRPRVRLGSEIRDSVV
ncbi:semaphorin-4B isoform X2 [Rhineura floridana]|uniref:semaphorin-4B isoform X2 n=1 Tax=Rhineura floridana TaxID=261503 RepID=UPI002AC7FC12|nr:semaphorin-4B isoform X2 [Rhineura floridana]